MKMHLSESPDVRRDEYQYSVHFSCCPMTERRDECCERQKVFDVPELNDWVETTSALLDYPFCFSSCRYAVMLSCHMYICHP